MYSSVSRLSRRLGASSLKQSTQRRRFVALAQQVTAVQPKPFLFPQTHAQRPKTEEFYLPLNFQVDVPELPGRRIPEKRYAFDEETDLVGQGFFAKVYKAVDAETQEVVAVKVVDKQKCPREIFNQELKVMSQIRDLKVKASVTGSDDEFKALGLHRDVYETEEDLCFVFDFHTGGDLFDEVVDNGALNEDEAKDLMQSLLPSVDSLHDNDFVHRDIKLENILLSKDKCRAERLKTVKLTDFGYAKKLGETDKFKNPAGTFGYVAPEVLRSRRYGPQCDVWSMGTVLFTVVAGYQPFPHKTESTGTETPEFLVSRELEAIQHGTKESSWEKEMEKPAFKNTSVEFKDLLKRMLDPNHKTRISAAEVLEHPWFNQNVEQALESSG